MSESVAALVTMSVESWAMVASGSVARTGGLFTSVTTTMNWFVALNGGRPLSVATVTNALVLGPSASPGVQVMTPSASIVAPGGGFSSSYEIQFAGRSESVAALVTTRVVCSA